jgi:hypothetical protein
MIMKKLMAKDGQVKAVLTAQPFVSVMMQHKAHLPFWILFDQLFVSKHVILCTHNNLSQRKLYHEIRSSFKK